MNIREEAIKLGYFEDAADRLVELGVETEYTLHRAYIANEIRRAGIASMAKLHGINFFKIYSKDITQLDSIKYDLMLASKMI